MKKINIILLVFVVSLSIATIVWHHQAYLLYKKSTAVENQHNNLINEQAKLLSDKSNMLDNVTIKNKALNMLKMQKPNKEYEF